MNPLQQQDIERFRKSADDQTVAAKAYDFDPEFKKLADHYFTPEIQQKLDPGTRKRLPSLLLNYHYYGSWEKENVDDMTATLSQQPKEKGFFGTISDYLQAPGDAVAGVALKGLSKFPGLETLGDAKDVQELPENLRQSGTVARYALPAAAGIATGGLGILPAAGVTAAAGATGSLTQQGLEAAAGEEKGLSDFTVKPAVAGLTDGLIDAATLGTFRLLKPAARIIGRGAQSVIRTTKGMADDAARVATLSPVQKEAVKSGVGEKVVRFISETTPTNKTKFQQMFDIALKRSEDVSSTAQPKEVVGESILNRVTHLVSHKKILGQQIDDVVKSLPADPVDITHQYDDLLRTLQQKGLTIRPNGMIRNPGAVPAEDVKYYQRLVDLLRPNNEGQVLRSPQRIHQIRKLVFDELDLAKARQETFSNAVDRTAERFRSNLMQPMGTAYQKANQAFAETVTPLKEFVKLIGYKGNLDEIGSKSLKVGEVAQRMLGNAADRPLSAIQAIDDQAAKTGFQASDDVIDQVIFSDMLEDFFGTLQKRSLAGQVERANKNLFKDAALSAQDAARGRFGSMVGRFFDVLTGQTMDDQIKALKGLLTEGLDDVPLSQFGGQEAARVATLTPLKKIPNTKGFIFHATTRENAEQILQNGFNPNSYFAPSPDIARAAVGDKIADPVILKIPASKLTRAFTDPNVPKDVPTFYSDISVNAKDISPL